MMRTFFRERSMKCIVTGIWVGAVALVAMGAAAPLSAQAADGKVAYVDTQEILAKTPGYAAAESLFAKEFDAAKADAAKINASIDSANGELERQSSIPGITSTQKAAKQKAFREYVQTAQQKLQGLDEKMGSRRRELLDPIQKRIKAVIEGVRAEGKYAFIFDVSVPNSGIVTADTSLDLTAKVIERLK